MSLKVNLKGSRNYSKMVSDIGKNLLSSVSDVALTGSDAYSADFVKKLNDAVSKIEKYITDEEEYVLKLKEAGDVLFERLATLSAFGVRTPDGVKEAMAEWSLLSSQVERRMVRNG